MPINEKLQEKNAEIEKILDNWGFRPVGISHGKREEKRRDIEKWLRRFLPSEFDDAFSILKKIQYHDNHIVDVYIEGLSKELKLIFEDNLSDVRFFPLGKSPASSGGNFLYLYSKELGLSEDNFPYTSLKETDLSDVTALVFFDDIIGSGNQAITFAKQNLQNITINKYYFAFLAFEKGYNNVKKSKYFENIIVHEILSDEFKAFSPNSQVFPDKYTRERIKKLCIKYGEELYSHPLGYDNSQALIVFPHNTPNNTLPIIWASDKNEKKSGIIWYPVWERKKIKRKIKDNNLPKIWNVPHNRNPNFIGRGKYLNKIHKNIASTSSVLPIVIHGPGGMGKTQLATEYVYGHAKDYSIVWWMRAEKQVSLIADYVALARELNLPEKNGKEEVIIVKSVRSKLETIDRWMLIFDNAPNQKELSNFLPQVQNGQVIITSQNPNWRGTATSMPLKVLKRKDSINFLRKRTGQTDENSADKLAEGIGDLPLALEQAGAYIEETGNSLSNYLEMFQKHKNELLRRGAVSTDYCKTVATTWEMAFNKILNELPVGIDLLNLYAFLAPDNIPKNLLIEGAQYLPESLGIAMSNPLSFDNAVAILRRYSLIEVTNDAISIHRLVQLVAKDKMNEYARKMWAEVALKLINETFTYESNDVGTWAKCSSLLPHALEVIKHAELHNVGLEQTGMLLNQTGLYLQDHAEFDEAKKHYERALKIGEVVYGPDHPTVASIVNNLGRVLHSLRDLEGAKKHYERALKIDEAVFGPDHPTVAIRVNNLGNVLYSMGDLEGAKKHYERALKIDEAVFGPDHPTVAIRVNNLGRVLYSMGDLEGAIKHYERALKIRTVEKYPFSYSESQRYLGNAYRDLGDFQDKKENLEKAICAYNKALKIWVIEKYPINYAKTQNDMGNAYRNLAKIHDKEDNLNQSIHAYCNALIIFNSNKFPIFHNNVLLNMEDAKQMMK